ELASFFQIPSSWTKWKIREDFGRFGKVRREADPLFWRTNSGLRPRSRRFGFRHSDFGLPALAVLGSFFQFHPRGTKGKISEDLGKEWKARRCLANGWRAPID